MRKGPVRARKLKAARARLGLSQAKLAKALGLHRRSVARHETSDLRIPRVVELAVKHLLATLKTT